MLEYFCLFNGFYINSLILIIGSLIFVVSSEFFFGMILYLLVVYIILCLVSQINI